MTSTDNKPDHSDNAEQPLIETEVWQGHPSHWTNIGIYLVCLLFSWLVVPAVYGIYRFLKLRNHKYWLTNERFKSQTGVFSLRRENLELYRVKDITLEEPFHLRLFGLGNIVVETSDKTNPVVTIHAIKAEEVIDLLRNQVERIRQLRHVRELDLE